MPGWPDVGRADDHRLLEALRRGDSHAPSSLYEAYADRLADYACTLTPDPDAAADAVHDALVAAQACVDRLKEPVRLRAWLYALTRFHCAVRSRGRTGATGPTAVLSTAEESDDPSLAALVHEALAELGGNEREVLHLAVRHGLSTGEAASVLGLTSRQVSARLGRARDHLENAAAAIVLARVGRAHCPDLSALVDSGVGASWQDGPLGTALRKRLSRHIADCKICGEGRARHVSADRLLDLIPIAFPPLSLRRRVLDTSLNPEREGTRRAAVERAGFDRRGFPVVPEGRSRRTRGRARRTRATPIMLAAACVFGTAGGLALVSGQAPASHLEAVRIPPTPPRDDLGFGPSGGAQETPPETAGPEESPEPSGTPDEGGTPSSAPTVRAPRAPAPAPQSRPRPSRAPAGRPPTRTPAAASLSASCPGDIGSAAGSVINLSAREAAAEWTATTTDGLAVSPAHGRLKAGATGRITVAVVDPGVPGSGAVTFRSAAGSPSCHISWRGQEGTGDADPEPDPPSDTPSSTPEANPSVSPSA
ncbi:hypothetical protein Mco01_21230 [Microbispora corallina]|uniref:Sigma-70 family RNA polymerase sigma factor n=1 Tax=Microbispora corallina TaxID=83302 RepID=A0ABQ4FWL0_9ACTN|nr:sigma-70 family RNA polymerase sigma factor [Microbispora corallina]GIH39123.1 hypothetical protein Mco01_21230 [Microbispora corallina]